MAYLQKVQTFSTSLNQGVETIVDQFNAYFAARPLTNILGMDYSRVESTTGAGDLHVRVVYAELDIVGVSYELRYYNTTPTQSAQEAFNADFAAGLNRVPLVFLDVTNHEKARGDNDQLLVVMAITDRGVNAGGNGLVGQQKVVFVAEPLADIAAGADGNCVVRDGHGLILSNATSVRNTDTAVWVAGELANVVFDLEEGRYLSIPNCCKDKFFPGLVPDPLVAPLDPGPCPIKEIVSMNPALM
jgi:uncharacterized protein (UPF0212 family)